LPAPLGACIIPLTLMSLQRAALLAALASIPPLFSCHPSQSTPAPSSVHAEAAVLPDAAPAAAPSSASLEDASPPLASASASATPRAEVGPYEIPFRGQRTVFFALPRSTDGPQRLIANLHGVCNPPGYACGYWVESASEKGLLVCPTGNARCGPESYNAPTWTSTYDKMEEDLERAIDTLLQRYPGIATRDGAILTGFSKGAYAAVQIALKSPGKWPYLILNEADVALSAKALREAGVLAVALIAGERGSQLPGERRTVQALTRQGFPARLWVMPGAGHFYSANIDQLMREAMDFVLAEKPTAPARP
jgi:predicted esterase